MSTSQHILIEQQAHQLRRAELSRLSTQLVSRISDALRIQHEKLLRHRQSREILSRAPLRSTIGTPA